MLKLWVKQGWANQFLSVRALNTPGLGVQAENERFYHVATAKEPLRLSLPGPVWLRVDHLRNGPTNTHYALLDKADQSDPLVPVLRERVALLGGGAGLGLAITRDLVRAHGGDIILSETGTGGSTFCFTLPL